MKLEPCPDCGTMLYERLVKEIKNPYSEMKCPNKNKLKQGLFQFSEFYLGPSDNPYTGIVSIDGALTEFGRAMTVHGIRISEVLDPVTGE